MFSILFIIPTYAWYKQNHSILQRNKLRLRDMKHSNTNGYCYMKLVFILKTSFMTIFFKWYGFWSSHWLDQDYRLFFFFDKLLACFPVKLFFSSFDLFLKRKCSSTEMAVTTQSVLICVTPWPSSKYQVVLVYTFSHVINKLRCNWFSSLY